MDKVIKYRHNAVSLNSLEAFAGIRGAFRQNCRDVYFVRMLGYTEGLPGKIRQMDAKMAEEMSKGRLYYYRISRLPGLAGMEDAEYYAGCYEHWRTVPQNGMQTKVSGRNNQEKLARQLGTACQELLEKYQKNKPSATESMQKNFIVKLLYWFDYVFHGMEQWSEQCCIKIVADNVEKEQEYLFYYLLTLVGCDVLLLQSRADAVAGGYRELSKEVTIGEFNSEKLPEFACGSSQEAAENPEKIVVKIPERNPKKNPNQHTNPHHKTDAYQHAESRQQVKPPQISAAFLRHQRDQVPQQHSGMQQEKSFEELAMLASSVVMIAVHDKHGEVFATGSGIMVGKDGYILTNDHVARGGCSYSVRIENDGKVYQTDEVIKYHSVLDLALLRIQRQLNPIPVYNGTKKLVRGQAVVAIGSPLGLFNSVSNGIISGFRTLDGVDMIQFTAPVSQGSSGGAVLNMQGEVIGISTAGFDRGQNINLAVGYENINMFIQGF